MNTIAPETLKLFPNIVKEINGLLNDTNNYRRPRNLNIGQGVKTSRRCEAIFETIGSAGYNLTAEQDVKPEKIVMPPNIYHEMLATYDFIRYGAIQFNDYTKSALSGHHLPKVFGMDIEIGDTFEVKSAPEFNKTINLIPIFKKLLYKLRGLTVIIKSRVRPEYGKITPEESRAQDALREIISEFEFRKYLKYGFIIVKGKSGKCYQIFKLENHIKVWEHGKVVEEICVYIKDVPPTDKLVAFKTMIEIDEESFKKHGNVYRNLSKVM